jgi:predicted transcriptional regulator
VADKKPEVDKGSLRRRFEAFAKDGSLAKLGSEARLVALYVLLRANWSQCTISMSQRSVAKHLGTHKTTVHRGVSQLEAAGILQKTQAVEGTTWAKYVVCAPVVNKKTAVTRRVQVRSRYVTRVVTPRDQGGHAS